MIHPQALSAFVLLGGGLGFWWWSHRHGASASGDQAGSVLQRFTHDLTAEAEQGHLDPVIGRDAEIERMIHILSRRSKNNPLLLGEPGVGKTAVVEGIVRKISAGDVPEGMKGKRVLALDLGALIGGTKYRGEFEERMKQLTNDIRSQARKIILFIDEVHMIGQAKGAEGAINVSDIIKPALARGELQMIGATTWKEYEQYIKVDDALNRRLQPVIVGEPSDEATMHILQGIKDIYEQHHRVHYTDEALTAAIQLSKKIQGRYLPDKAIDLMDEAGAKVSIEASHLTRHAIGLLHAAGTETRKKMEFLTRQEQEINAEIGHLKTLQQKLGNEAELSEVQQRLEHLFASVDKVRKSLLSADGARPPNVTAADIAEIVKDWIGDKGHLS